MSRKSPSPTPEGKKSVLPFVIIGGVLVAVIVAVVLMSQRAAQDDTPPQSNANSSATPTGPRQVAAGAADPYARGGANAPVTLEEFSDFQCPACGVLEPGLRKVVQDYGDRVRLVFRNFPLVQAHQYAFLAARAAEAAGQQGKFWEMHDALYDHQEEWSKSMEPRVQFDSYATRLGLDVQRFKGDMERADISDRIKADMQRGNSLNVRGTPTVYLNGRELMPGKLVSEADLRREIDATLGSGAK